MTSLTSLPAKATVITVSERDRPFYFVFPGPDDHILVTMRETRGFYELAMLRALQLVVKPGDHVLDIGANIGTHAVFFAGVAGCRVTAFEAVGDTAVLLRENRRINGLEGLIDVHAMAVGSASGKARILSSNATNSGATQLAEDAAGDVPMVSLDAMLGQLHPVRLLKIDVEGMEGEVLVGAGALLERDRPVIACECLERQDFDRIDGLLRQHGYVACNVFNASATYVFLPAADLAARPELQALIAASLLTVREDSRAALRQARAASRSASEAVAAVSELRTQQQVAVSDLHTRQQAAVADLCQQQQIVVEELRRLQESTLKERTDEALAAIAALGDRLDRDLALLHPLPDRNAELSARLAKLEAELQSTRARFATLSDDVVRAARAQSDGARQAIESIEHLRLEHGVLAKDFQRRMTRAERRFDKLLDGRVFGSLRRVKHALQAIGVMRKADAPVARTAAPATQPAAASSPKAPAAARAPAAAPATVVSPAAKEAIATPATVDPASPQATLPRPDKVRIAGVAYMSRPKAGTTGHLVTHSGQPLISVIMTSYNTGTLIEPAVRSITAQTWTNLELIIVDDCSTDDTRAIVERLASEDPRIKLLCFGDNRGTYFCKNFGITRSNGVAVTFMDSDDTSDPNRIALQYEALNRPGFAVSTCNHIRVDGDGKTLEINGVTERIAYISQMIKRSVLDEVGFFDTIRTSADDEMLRRIKTTYGPESHANVKRVLYTALLRDGSLTRDPENAINFVEPRRENQSFLSPQRRHYAAMVTRWHELLAQKGLRPYMPFPVVRRPFPVFGKLVVATGRYDHNAVSACVASFPPRREKLREVVARLLPQVDQLYVYLNGYEELPDFLRHSRITAELGGTARDLRDNGKFHFTKQVPSGFVLTVDDDIAYPADYVQTLIRKVDFYERRAVVGLHGTIFAKPIQNYFRGRTLYHFEHELAHDVVVNQLGTGTVAFHTDLFRPDIAEFKSTGMADVWLALACKRIGAPMIAIERPAGYLSSLGFEESTLFREFRRDDSRQTKLVRSVEPWSEAIGGDLGSILATREREFGPAFGGLLPRPAPASTAPIQAEA